MNDPLEVLQSVGLATATVPSLIGTTRVENVIPSNVTVPYRLAIIGEAPGQDEEAYGIPFVGASGQLLENTLSAVGIQRSQCFIGNVCPYRPPGNKIEAFGYSHPLVQSGLEELRSQLRAWKPNTILCLGNTPMWALTGNPFGLRDSGYSISDYACFITQSNLDIDGQNVKLVGSFHPANVLRTYKNLVFLGLSCRRAREEATHRDFVRPYRRFDLDLTAFGLCEQLDSWPSGKPAAIDIEGGIDGWVCMSVVPRIDYGFIIAFGSYSHADQGRIYRSLSRFLYRTDIPKVLQNGLYDCFVLQYGFNIVVRNVAEDTMLKHAEIYPELPKALDVQTSIYTREPQWKFLIAYSKKEQARRRKMPGFDQEQEKRNKWIACCTDSAVTLENCYAQDKILDSLPPDSRQHYVKNLLITRALLYMELRGMAYDKELAQTELAICLAQKAECAQRLAIRAGYSLTGTKGGLSNTKLKRCLYEEKHYPVHKIGRGADAKETTNAEAMLLLQGRKEFQHDPFIADILLHRKLESTQETLQVQTDPDGRVRCGYNAAGTETFRLNCYKSPTGSGANLQTITKKLRRLYRADPEYFFGQCDLAGADGWTVAARCLSLGDSTMWDDYKGGLKPAKILAMMFHHGVESTLCDRVELKRRCDLESAPGGCCDQDSWLYFACKRIQHATNYGVQEKTAQNQIMSDSYKVSGKPIYVELKVIVDLQRYYLMRYIGVRSYHAWGSKSVIDGKPLLTASGHIRHFYGRKTAWNYKTKSLEHDQDTWREYLASEPQTNTTYATNLALLRMWLDPRNRHTTNDGSCPRHFIIEPLHQVHDALNFQFRKEHVTFATEFIPSCFDNTLIIAGIPVKIPYEGAYGPSWGELGPKYGGGIL